MPEPRRKLLVWGAGLAFALATAGVFSLYQHPDFLVQLSFQLWSCF